MNYYVGKIVLISGSYWVKLKVLRADAFGFLFEVIDRADCIDRDSIYYERGGKLFIPHDHMLSFKILE